MNLHANHRTCPRSRLLLCRRVVEQGWKLAEAAEAAGCSVADGVEMDCPLPRRRSGAV